MVHTFPKDICPKVNVIARLEFELAYYDPAVHRFNHFTPMTLHKRERRGEREREREREREKERENVHTYIRVTDAV